MSSSPPKKTFTDAAEAKRAMVEVISTLQKNSVELLKASVDAGEDKQKKIAALMPMVQKMIADVTTAYGFPPGPMGIMLGMAAFNNAALPTDATPTPGLGVSEIKKAIDLLQKAMMSGTMADEGELAEIMASLN